MVGAKVNK